MRRQFTFAIGLLTCCLAQQVGVVAAAQQQRPRVAVKSAGLVTTKTGAADGASSPALTGERRPLYRIHKSDVLELHFTFSPELDQSASVQPDGFLALRGVQPIYVEGLSLPQVQQAVSSAYADRLRDPEITITLNDFEHPTSSPPARWFAPASTSCAATPPSAKH
ncbi:MAG: polysaccharide biosynthesis/export family protein [Acidobacteriales bacterium]|nr:polysaccharide biosynthesis/export family protein [Terriglobales bacterium]